jgi:hypothetical protein
MADPNPPRPAPLPTSSLAVVSLVAGILGVTIAWGLGSLVAVITGTMAMRDIRARPVELGGTGMARAGLVLGWVGLGLIVVVACAFCLFFLLLVPAMSLLGRTAEPGAWLLDLARIV